MEAHLKWKVHVKSIVQDKEKNETLQGRQRLRRFWEIARELESVVKVPIGRECHYCLL